MNERAKAAAKLAIENVRPILTSEIEEALEENARLARESLGGYRAMPLEPWESRCRTLEKRLAELEEVVGRLKGAAEWKESLREVD